MSKTAAAADTAHVLVVCADYNGHKNVEFVMKRDDFRLNDERFSGNYTVLENGAFEDRRRAFRTVSGKLYSVYADWSVKLIA